MPAGEEALSIGPPRRALAARLLVPATPRAGAVVCHPHPEYGGDMDNPVVVAVARGLAAAGVATLRFDFGPFSGGAEEVGDARAALAALAPRLPAGTPAFLVGYSFGAWVALRAAVEGAAVAGVIAIAPPLGFLDWGFLRELAGPVAFVVGERDEFCPAGRLRRVVDEGGGRIVVHSLPGADHFLAGREAEVAAAVIARLGA